LAELAGTTRSGLAAGFGLTSSSLGIVVGPPIFGFIVDRFGSYAPAWQGLAILALVAFALLSQVREPPAEAK